MPNTTTISATQMHKQRGQLLKQCAKHGQHFIVEKDGIPLVALVPIEDYRLLEALLKQRKQTR